MKTILKYVAGMVLVAGIVIALGQIGIARSHADTGSFIYSLEHDPIVTFGGSVGNNLDLGYRVCSDWNNGYTRYSIVHTVYLFHDYDMVSASQFVTHAINELCP